DHVKGWDSFGDANNQLDTGISRLHDGIGSERRRNEDYRGVGSRLFFRLSYRVEHRKSLMDRSALARSHSAYDLRTISFGLQSVKGTLSSGNTLNNQSGALINQDAQRKCLLTTNQSLCDCFARLTTLLAASFMPSATNRCSPEDLKISWPFSTLVPSR